jgi:hypothetical protein
MALGHALARAILTGETAAMLPKKCSICGLPYGPDCDFQQGRCPLHPPLIDTQMWLKNNILRQIYNTYSGLNLSIVEIVFLAGITLYLTWVLVSAIIMK